MDRLHRSIFFSGIERYGSAFFFMGSTAVVSRLLTPRQFGIYAAVVALTTVATACSQEFGGANYLIQKPTLSEQDIRTAFTITFLMSALLGAFLFELRDTVAAFYSEDGLKNGIAVFATGFLLMPFSATLSALLRREMAFSILARCNLVAAFVAAATSVGLAALGWSYIGLLMGSVLGQAAGVLLLISCRPNFRIFRFSLNGWRDVVGFGAYSSAVVIINVIYQSFPQLILGRVLDFAAVGLFGRAAGITQLFDKLFLGAVNPVIMPAIAAQTRAGADLKRVYLQAIELLTAIQWPFLTFVALIADPIVRIWFGAGWVEVVPLARFLCLASLSYFAACLTYPVLVAAGRVRDTLISSLISLPPAFLVIFAASFSGVRAVAASTFLTFPLEAAIAIYFIGRRLTFGPADLLRATLKSAVVTAFSCSGVMAVIGVNDFSFTLSPLALFTATVAGLVAWWLGLATTGHPLLAHLGPAAQTIFSVMPRLRFPHMRSARKSI
jgi:O-antigen/teichoic acid export membrane protein